MARELTKRVVLTRYWIGDVVYHRSDGNRGLVVTVSINTERYYPKYYCVFEKREGEWCEEMELSDEKIYQDDTPPPPPR